MGGERQWQVLRNNGEEHSLKGRIKTVISDDLQKILL